MDDALRWTADPVPVVPGYDLHHRLGRGATGTVWAASREPGGAPVAVKVVRDADRDAVEREVAVLRSISHDHVLPLLDALALDDGGWALVVERAEGGSLADLVDVRGHLSPGEVATVLTAVGSGLAALHAAGVWHGDLAPTNVLLHRDGRPVVADLGAAVVGSLGEAHDRGTAGYLDPLLLAGAAPGPAADVFALGAIAWCALTGEAPPAAPVRPALLEVAPHLPADLAAVVEHALEPDPSLRPGAAEVARAAYDAEPPTALLVPSGAHDRTPAVGDMTHRLRRLAAADADDPSPARHRRRPCLPTHLRLPGRLRRWGTPAAVLLVGLLLVGWLGPRPGRAATAPVRGSAGTASASAESRDVVDDVRAAASARAVALARADAAPLRGADLPGSPAQAADLDAVRRLQAAGLCYRGVVFEVGAAEVVAQHGAARTVRAEVTTSAYDVVDRAGRTVRRIPPSGPTSVVLDLQRSDGRWLVSRVR